MTTTPDRIILVVGPRPLAESVGQWDDGELRFVPVPAAAVVPAVPATGEAHTLRLAWDADGDTHVLAGSQRTPVAWRDLFDDMLAEDALGLGHAASPLWLIVRDQNGAHLFVALRHGLADALFIRLHVGPLADEALPELSRCAHELQRQHALFLNNHQCYYRRFFPGEEIEHKYTLDPATDIWGVTLRLYRAVRAGELAGFIPEYADEFQAWDYVNHLFAIPEPRAERGYVSFIPLSTGGYTLKRKWFDADATRRGEKYLPAPEGLADLDTHVRETMGLAAAERLPSFRRVRYDLNFESLTTGHVYGIFFDRSVTLDDFGDTLVQCELEYIRTRSILPLDEAALLDELEVVARWLEAFLAAEGLSSRRGVYSKLSFLRDAVAGRGLHSTERAEP